jgi:TonB family protein
VSTLPPPAVVPTREISETEPVNPDPATAAERSAIADVEPAVPGSGEDANVRVDQRPPLEVSALEMEARLLDGVQPEYPDEARRVGVAGNVILRTWVDRDGTVTNVSRLTGDETLARAAMDAVRQWQYRPWVDDGGEPVDVVTSVVIRFSIVPAEPVSTPAARAGDAAPEIPIPPCTAPRQVALTTGQLVSFANGAETLALQLVRVAPSLEGGTAAVFYWIRTARPWWTGDRADSGEVRERLSEAAGALDPETYVEFTLTGSGRAEVAVSPDGSLEVGATDAGRGANAFTICRS